MGFEEGTRSPGVQADLWAHVIPHKANELDRIKLLALRIEGWAPRRGNFSSEGSGAELDVTFPAVQVQDWDQGITSSSSSYVSPDSSDSEKKEGEEAIS